MELNCCDTEKPISRKHVLVRNPKKIKFGKKIIVGKQFRKLLRALYRDHPNASQAINGKFQLSETQGENKVEKVNYDEQDRSEAGKNKTIHELRSAILELVEKLKKKTQSSRSTERKDEKQEVLHKLAVANNSIKTAKAKLQENYDTRITRPSLEDSEISAKHANQLDLLNFISRMKSMEGVHDADTFHPNEMHYFNGMGMNVLNGVTNARDILSPTFSSPVNQMYGQGQNYFLSGNGVQMQETNIAEQRKFIEDQMQNHLAQLQRNFKLFKQQQPNFPNLQNDQTLNTAGGLQYPIPAPSKSMIPFRFAEAPLPDQAQLFYRETPYVPIRRPLRQRLNLPLFPPINPAFGYTLNNEEAGNDVDDDDEDVDNDDYDRYRDEPPRHYPAPEYDDADIEDDEEGRYSPNDER